ncbi:MAG: branched-chain amino acid ABC transporter permease [Chloroflexota bacterium]|jgi:branched-chain amino acid transport system permease protein
MKTLFSDLYKKANTGFWPIVIAFAFLIIGTITLFQDPRSLGAFLVLMTTPIILYFMNMPLKIKAFIGLLLIVIILPVIGIKNIFLLEVIFQMAVFAALALGLNIVIGMAGLLDLGYVAFYAVGAYAWAIFGSKQMSLLYSIPGAAPANAEFFLDSRWFWLFLFLGVGLAALMGILLGLPVLRVKGDYLAIVTLGFGEVIRVLALNLDKPINLTNGPQGITPIQRPPLPPEGVLMFLRSLLEPLVGHEVTDADFYNVMFYFLALIIIVIVIVVATRLEDSRIGRAWTAIREDETAAIAMGIPLVKMKLAAFAAGASFAGAMGALYAANRTFVSPETFSFQVSIGVLTMVILGGLGSIPGVIFGASAVTLLNIQILQNFSLYLSDLRQSDAVIPIINFAWKDLSNQLDPAKYQKLVFGIILILMMIFRPSGLIPAERRQRELGEEKE